MPSPSPSRQHVLMVVLDTARAKTVLSDADPVAVPRITRFFENGTTYTNATANAPWTLPSHASMFSGLHTADHGAHAGSKEFDIPHRSLPELAAAAGYQTVGYSNNPWVSDDVGFADGFEDFLVRWKPFGRGKDLDPITLVEGSLTEQLAMLRDKVGIRDAPYTLANAVYMRFLRDRYDSGARITNRRIDRWLSSDRDPDRPVFAFVNYIEPHLEYDPPEEYWEPFLSDDVSVEEARGVNQDPWAYLTGTVEMTERDFEILRALYRASLRYLDEQVATLLDSWADHGLLEDTVVIVVGDHGEHIGDHGLMDHQYSVYDSLVHVPLWIRVPGRSQPARCDEVVELRDIYPTVARLVGADEPTAVERVADRDLLAVADGDLDPREAAVIEYVYPRPSVETLEARYGSVPDAERLTGSLQAVRTTRWKLIIGDDVELYDLDRDPGEHEDVAGAHPGVVDDLVTTIDARLGDRSPTTADASADLSDATENRLASLGYI